MSHREPLPDRPLPDLDPPEILSGPPYHPEGEGGIASRLTVGFVFLIAALALTLGSILTALVMVLTRQNNQGGELVNTNAIVADVQARIDQDAQRDRTYRCANIAREIDVYSAELHIPRLPAEVKDALRRSIESNQALAIVEHCPANRPPDR